MPPLAPIAPRLAKLIPLLASDSPGEVVATAHAIGRTLDSIGADFHDLAAALLPANDAAAEGDAAMAMSCLDALHLFDPRERMFLISIAAQLRRGRQLSVKQADWLQGLYGRVQVAAETAA
jgi:hypothetical protein